VPRDKRFPGFCCVALWRPKTDGNVGGSIRAAHAFGANLVVVGAPRFSQKGRVERTDPSSSHRSIPVTFTDDIFTAMPYDVPVVAIETGSDENLQTFDHPRSCTYLFGSEDRGLPDEALAKCDAHISIPSHSLNLAAAVNVVMYDRRAKIYRT